MYRPALGVIAHIAADGRLSLRSTVTGEQHCCGGEAAAMWIALQRHGWKVGPAAAELARVSGDSPTRIRVRMDRVLRGLHSSGMLVNESESTRKGN